MPRIVHTADGNEFIIEEASNNTTPSEENTEGSLGRLLEQAIQSLGENDRVLTNTNRNDRYNRFELQNIFAEERPYRRPLFNYGTRQRETTSEQREIFRRIIGQPTRQSEGQRRASESLIQAQHEERERLAREEQSRLQERNRIAEEERQRRSAREQVQHEHDNTYRTVYSDASPRTFGVEIEAYGLSHEAVRQLLQNNNIQCVIEPYNHHRRTHWKITTDASIEATDTFELVSPVLSGQEGLDIVEKVVKLLDENGVRVNASCGFHVHVGMQDMTTTIAKNLVKRYAKYEDKIDSFMPTSRRGGSNVYCASVKNYLNNYERRISDASLIAEVIDIMGDRRKKLNLKSYLRHGTVEFRHHNGTLNAKKAVNWILFCLNFVEATIVLSNQTQRPNRYNLNTKIGKFYAWLSAGNAIASYVAAGKFNTSITEIENMIRKIRRETKMKIRKNTNRQYYMVDASEAIVDNSLYLGMPNEVQNWYEGRAENFIKKNKTTMMPYPGGYMDAPLGGGTNMDGVNSIARRMSRSIRVVRHRNGEQIVQFTDGESVS